ncbi:MAG: glycosyltransferase family 39 protein [Alphaproteobacteria bacterium]|nr:glycosyltransferase family 39 protein [Alphaproteobacteria bacterium]
MNNISCFISGGIIVFSFFLNSLFSQMYGFDILKANLLLGMCEIVLFNPFEVEHKKRLILGCIGAFFFLLTFFFNPNYLVCYLFLSFLCLAFYLSKYKNDINLGKIFIFTAVFFNLSFVSNTKIGDVQYDFASCYNYIEYILDNNFMFWKENPLLTRPSYSSYHPILHFFIAGLGIRVGELISHSKDFASEAVQIIFVSYLFGYYIVASKIFKLINFQGIVYIGCVAFVSLFPIYNAIGGFFNNDGLLLLFQALIIYYTLLYHKDGDAKKLYMIAFYVMLAGLTKLSGILVIGGGGVVGVLKLYKNRDKKTLFDLIICFLLIILGYSIWPLYQYKVLNLDFGFVPPQTHLSIENYSIAMRFSPLRAFFYENMFYNDFGINLWETMTKTALFGQWDFSYRGKAIFWLIECFVVLYKVLIAIIWVGVFYLALKKYKNFMTYFLLALLGGVLAGQIMFSLKHPYMCNQDFRYVAILTTIMAMILGEFLKNLSDKLKIAIISLFILFSLLSMFIWWYISW